MIERLNGLGLQPLGPTGLGRFAPENCRQDFTFEEDEDDDVSMRWVEFNHQDLPKLARDGWRITFGEDYPYQVVAADDAWKVDVNDSGIDWFDLDLGIDVDGERVALLPILLDLFERAPEDLSPTALDEIGEDHVFGTLPDGRLLPIPAARLKAMLGALYELFASRRIGDDGKLRLSRAEMTRLTAIETALPNGALHWTGGQMLRDMARRLASTNEIPAVEPPKGLKATLRHYQEDGFAWLQFLSGLGLSGVLADDMGLGKTVQALAHILAERNAGRLIKPCLIVCPTSLVPTWRNEARKFAPDLTVLVLHGNQRRELFDEIEDHDVVLTSYALLLRDKDLLLEHKYRMVVLDEAQAIKNPATKLARTACLLKAEHRLALSGTPMENHLGELWSVFHFLMPGFLGDRETFRRVFRNQIEKEGDAARQQLLASRVRPFLLRRTKEQVAVRAAAQAGGAARRSSSPRASATSTRACACPCTSGSATRSSSAASPAATSRSWRPCSSCARSAATRACSRAAAAATCPAPSTSCSWTCCPAWSRPGRSVIVFSQFVEMLDLIEAGLVQRADPVRQAHRPDQGPRDPGPPLPGRRGADLPDQPQGRRHRPHADPGRHRHPLRPMVEPGGREPGHRPRPPHRPGQDRVRLQADRRGHGRGEDGRAAGQEAGAGRLRPVRHRRRPQLHRGRHRGPVRAAAGAGQLAAPGRRAFCFLGPAVAG